MMYRELQPSRAISAAGALFTAQGTLLLLAAALAPGVSEALLAVALAPVLLATGLGLLRRRAWGWYLGVVVAVSGATVVSLRMLGSGGPDWSLWAPLLTNLLVLFLLIWGRRRTIRTGTRASLGALRATEDEPSSTNAER